MPELPEVETTVRGLARHLEGERIARVEVRRPDLRRPFPPDLVQALTGARITGLGRRAKYGLIETDRERTLVFHLGMSGRWRIEPDAIGTSPMIDMADTDFPEPDSPTIPKTSSLYMSNDTSLTALTVPASV